MLIKLRITWLGVSMGNELLILNLSGYLLCLNYVFIYHLSKECIITKTYLKIMGYKTTHLQNFHL